VTPAILTEELFGKLVERKKNSKHEVLLEGDIWRHSRNHEPNSICEASDFFHDLKAKECSGILTVAFAVVGSLEERHVHDRHIEIYFSEHELHAEYRVTGEDHWRCSPADMADGGLIVFGPGVAHRVTQIKGLTLVIGVPAVERDRAQVT
jgi:hypothetical protein